MHDDVAWLGLLHHASLLHHWGSGLWLLHHAWLLLHGWVRVVGGDDGCIGYWGIIHCHVVVNMTMVVIMLLVMLVRLLGNLGRSLAANTAEEAAESKEDDAKDCSNDDSDDFGSCACCFRAAHAVYSAAKLALGYGNPLLSRRGVREGIARVGDGLDEPP